MTPPGDVTQLLAGLKRGDPQARERLAEQVYGELKRIAARSMRDERANHTLQPTALVNEAYLKLMGHAADRDWQSRSHFFAVASQVMRQVLVDHARAHRAGKRTGGRVQVELHDGVAEIPVGNTEMLLALDEALRALASFDARAAQVVELRYFGGLSVEETAGVLGVSEKTIKRDWAAARSHLSQTLGVAAP